MHWDSIAFPVCQRARREVGGRAEDVAAAAAAAAAGRQAHPVAIAARLVRTRPDS